MEVTYDLFRDVSKCPKQLRKTKELHPTAGNINSHINHFGIKTHTHTLTHTLFYGVLEALDYFHPYFTYHLVSLTEHTDTVTEPSFKQHLCHYHRVHSSEHL